MSVQNVLCLFALLPLACAAIANADDDLALRDGGRGRDSGREGGRGASRFSSANEQSGRLSRNPNEKGLRNVGVENRGVYRQADDHRRLDYGRGYHQGDADHYQVNPVYVAPQTVPTYSTYPSYAAPVSTYPQTNQSSYYQAQHEQSMPRLERLREIQNTGQ